MPFTIRCSYGSRFCRIPVSRLCLVLVCLLPWALLTAQPAGSNPNRGYAGIQSATENNAQLLKAFGLTRGAIVIEVVKGSPAQKAGIQPDDVILAIAGTPVKGPEDLTALMSRIQVGTTVIFTIDRNGESLNIPLKLVSFAEAFPGAGDVTSQSQSASRGPDFGMTIRDFQAAERSARKFEGDGGIEVLSVERDSFAAQMGLQPHDVILSINRHPVASSDEFLRSKASIQGGDALALRVARLTGSGEPGANARWETMLVSGTAPSASAAARALTDKMRTAESLQEQLAPQPHAPRPPTFRERLGAALAAQMQDSVQGRPMGMGGGSGRCPVGQLMGEWGGVEVTGGFRAIDVSFRINPDGRYDYFAGQGNAAFVTHSGVYQIADNPDQRYPCRVTFNPDPSTIQVASQAHLFAVRSRDLLDDQPRTFLYKFFPSATHLMLAGTWTDWRNDIGTVGLDRR